MDPMTKLAKMLGEVPSSSQEKLAESMEQYSIDELKEILRGEGMGKAAGKHSKEKKSFILHPYLSAAAAAKNHEEKAAKKEKKSTMTKLSAPLERAAETAGQVLAKTAAPGLSSPMLKGVTAVGKGLGKVMGNSAVRNAAIGAGVGAATGAATGTGMMRGAVTGGAMGLGAKEGIKALGGMQNRGGRLMRGALRRGGSPL